MQHILNIGRRKAIVTSLCAMFSIVACSTQPARPAPITLVTDGIKSIKDLILAMKNASADRLPATSSDEGYLTAIAKSFVANARETAEQYRLQLPSWIQDKLPGKKASANDGLDARDALLAVTVLGIVFLVPKLFLVTLVLGSLTILTTYILVELKKLASQET